MARSPAPHLEWQESTSNASSPSSPLTAPKLRFCSLHTPCKHLMSKRRLQLKCRFFPLSGALLWFVFFFFPQATEMAYGYKKPLVHEISKGSLTSQSGLGPCLFSHKPYQTKVFLRALLPDCISPSKHNYFLNFMRTTATGLSRFVSLTAKYL